MHIFTSWTRCNSTPLKRMLFTHASLESSGEYSIVGAQDYELSLLRSLLTTLTCAAEASSPDCCSRCCPCDPRSRWDPRGLPWGGRWTRCWSGRGCWAEVSCSRPAQPSGMERAEDSLWDECSWQWFLKHKHSLDGLESWRGYFRSVSINRTEGQRFLIGNSWQDTKEMNCDEK